MLIQAKMIIVLTPLCWVTVPVPPVVVRNDEWTWRDICRYLYEENAFDNIVISPGPGSPACPEDIGEKAIIAWYICCFIFFSLQLLQIYSLESTGWMSTGLLQSWGVESPIISHNQNDCYCVHIYLIVAISCIEWYTTIWLFIQQLECNWDNLARSTEKFLSIQTSA